MTQKYNNDKKDDINTSPDNDIQELSDAFTSYMDDVIYEKENIIQTKLEKESPVKDILPDFTSPYNADAVVENENLDEEELSKQFDEGYFENKEKEHSSVLSDDNYEDLSENREKRIFYAALYLSGKPVELSTFRKMLNPLNLENRLINYSEEFNKLRIGVCIRMVSGGYQLVADSDVTIFLEKFFGEKTESRPLNRATQSIRQTGSSIKPIAVVAPAIDKKIITAATMVDDTERDFAEGYHPIDYTSPLGEITVRRAIESSQNVPFVEIMEDLTPKTSMKYLKKMGISTLTEDDESLALALGGLDKGISPLEMAGAYATIANNGQYIEPTFYTEVKRNNGKTLVKTKQKKTKVFSEEVAYIMQELLTQPIIGNHGTAKYCGINGIDIAAKTGTTDDNYDRWLCGFSPYYTCVCWYGYDQCESIDYNKRNPSGLLWANVMSRIHTGLEGRRFEKPDKIEVLTICDETGKIAKTGCQNTHKENFLKNTKPDVCEIHGGSEILSDSYYKDTNSGTIQAPVNEITAPEEETRTTTPAKTENIIENKPKETQEPLVTTKPSEEPTQTTTTTPSETTTPTSTPSTTPSEPETSNTPDIEDKIE